MRKKKLLYSKEFNLENIIFKIKGRFFFEYLFECFK